MHSVRVSHSDNSLPLMLDAVESYLCIKGNVGHTFVRAAKRNEVYVAKTFGNRPMASSASGALSK